MKNDIQCVNDTYHVPDTQSCLIVVDYFEKIVGTETDDYLEFVIEYHADLQKFYLTVYKHADSKETSTTFAVDFKIMNQLEDICRRHKVFHWHSHNELSSVDGILIIFKYQYLGKKIRLCSDEMIENGISFFYEVKNVLSEAQSDFQQRIEKESK